MKSGLMSDRSIVSGVKNCGISADIRKRARIIVRYAQNGGNMIEERKLADEGKAAFYSSENMKWQDRCQFVSNLGWLLGQTREYIVGMRLARNKDQSETAIIIYNNGSIGEVNVTCDSYAAIVKDVMRHI